MVSINFREDNFPSSKVLRLVFRDFLLFIQGTLNGIEGKQFISRLEKKFSSQERTQLFLILEHLIEILEKSERILLEKSFSSEKEDFLFEEFFKFQTEDPTCLLLDISETAKNPSSDPSEAGVMSGESSFLTTWLTLNNSLE